LTAAVATGYSAISPAVQGYAYLAIGLGITFIVIGFGVSLFKKKTPRTGYFTSTNGGALVYDADQELGKMNYDIQTKGYWIK